jgi:hypothetical protein
MKTTHPPERLPYSEWIAYIFAASRARHGFEADRIKPTGCQLPEAEGMKQELSINNKTN